MQVDLSAKELSRLVEWGESVKEEWGFAGSFKPDEEELLKKLYALRPIED